MTRKLNSTDVTVAFAGIFPAKSNQTRARLLRPALVVPDAKSDEPRLSSGLVSKSDVSSEGCKVTEALNAERELQ